MSTPAMLDQVFCDLAASDSPPDWQGICKGQFFFENVGAVIDRPHCTAGFAGGE